MQWAVWAVLLAALLHVTCANQSGCKYGRGDGFDRGTCDTTTNTRTMTLVLKKGDSTVCEATKQVTKSCGATEDMGDMARDGGCKYEWDEGSECDPDTNMREVSMTLVEGDPEKCEMSKTSTRRCSGANGANGGIIGNGKKNKRGRKGGKKEGKKEGKKAGKKEGKKGGKKGKRAEGGKGNKGGKRKNGDGEKCKYGKDKNGPDSGLSICDPISKMRTMDLVLKSGDSATCEASKQITKHCVPEGCVYVAGNWTECSDDVKVSTREDTLNSTATTEVGLDCHPNITRSRPCKNQMARQEKKDQRKVHKANKQNRNSHGKKNKNKGKKMNKGQKKGQKMTERKQAKLQMRREKRGRKAMKRMGVKGGKNKNKNRNPEEEEHVMS